MPLLFSAVKFYRREQEKQRLRGELAISCYFIRSLFLVHLFDYLPLTFSASLNPFPNKLKASTSSMIAMPGARASMGLWVMMKL